MENNEGQRPRRSFSPEAKAYRVWLKERDKKEEGLPPKEKREKLKKTLKEVRSSQPQQNEQETEEQKAKREAREKGEKRLREIVERGELEESFLQYVGACLECEPWEAFARIEKHTNIDVQISAKKRFAEAFKEKVKEEKAPWGIEKEKEKEEEQIRATRIPMLMMALDRHWYAQEIASEILSFEEKRKADFGNTVGDRSAQGSFLLSQDRGTKVAIPSKQELALKESWNESRDRVSRFEQRSDYWTMVRAILAAHPKVYGFSNAKEVDRAIGKRVEQIGRIFNVEFRLVNGVARIGESPVKTEAMESLEKADAEAIIAIENRARLAIENREKKFKEEMGEMCRKLLDLNRESDTASTDLAVREEGLVKVVRFLREVLSNTVGKEAWERQKKLNDLNRRREELAIKLEKKNNEKWQDNSWKYASRFSPPDGNEVSGEMARHANYNYLLVQRWTAIAEGEAEKIVDEFIEESKT